MTRITTQLLPRRTILYHQCHCYASNQWNHHRPASTFKAEPTASFMTYSEPPVNNRLANYQWTWIGQGLTCNNYTFSNQPPGQAFYALELPVFTLDACVRRRQYLRPMQCAFGLNNAVAVAAGGYFSLALTNGRVIGWGDDTYGETSVPARITNVISVAAGIFRGVAVLASGSVTNWGCTNQLHPRGKRLLLGDQPASSAPASLPTSWPSPAGLRQGLALMSNGTLLLGGRWRLGQKFRHLTSPASKPSPVVGNSMSRCPPTAPLSAWGNDSPGLADRQVSRSDLAQRRSNAAGGHGLALRPNGTVEGWGTALVRQ